MSVTSNPATGEVVVEFEGETFRLRATMGGIGALERAFAVTGLKGIEERLIAGAIDDMLTALKCLCVSGNGDALDGKHYSLLPQAFDLVWKTMTSGLPDASKKKTMRRPATETTNGKQLPGRDSAPLPLAS